MTETPSRIKGYVARAMTVAMMESDQIEKLHGIERIRGYLIPPWNIQSLFGLPTAKERWKIPEKVELLQRHNARIENEIKATGLAKAELTKEEREESPILESVLWAHSFDWNVHKKSGQIIWDFSGPGIGKAKAAPKEIDLFPVFPETQ